MCSFAAQEHVHKTTLKIQKITRIEKKKFKYFTNVIFVFVKL